MLRAEMPEVKVPPGLETRIVANLRPRAERRVSRWWWLAGPASVAVGVGLLIVRPQEPVAEPEEIVVVGPVVEEVAEPLELAINAYNPLAAEGRALGRDATRAGRFLIDCLPSLPGVE